MHNATFAVILNHIQIFRSGYWSNYSIDHKRLKICSALILLKNYLSIYKGYLCYMHLKIRNQ